MPTLNQVPVASVPSLGRLRLAIYAVAALVAAALLLVPQWSSSPDQTEPPVAATPAASGLNVAALEGLAQDLEAWRSLLQDPRLGELQAPAQLREAQPGNLSPFLREVVPAPSEQP